MLYCILFLHQTTTFRQKVAAGDKLYCILFLHQTTTRGSDVQGVYGLYCILFLHQTTTITISLFPASPLYCILFLHQTTTCLPTRVRPEWLYCILFLHQTTTVVPNHPACRSCIASSFYIKPQHRQQGAHGKDVVLHPLSTSNHNVFRSGIVPRKVVLHPLSTSNHNYRGSNSSKWALYCILFLHQTTTLTSERTIFYCCIASSFYIKPQLLTGNILLRMVVLHPLSTSNHNLFFSKNPWWGVVLHPLSTSNHNDWRAGAQTPRVVLHPLSTSNHNLGRQTL